MKKKLCLILSLAMILGMFPSGIADAADPDETSQQEISGAAAPAEANVDLPKEESLDNEEQKEENVANAPTPETGDPILPASRSGYYDSGSCGDNLTWVYVLDNTSGKGTLTISGNGPMEDYDPHGDTPKNIPWDDYQAQIDTCIIEEGVTGIGNYAFSQCSQLTDITLPDGLTSIGESAFYECVNLTRIELSGSVTDIGSYAFSQCSQLTGITLPDGLTSIGESAFDHCVRLGDIELPDSITSIGRRAFACCECLSSISIPRGVTIIEEEIFYLCKQLQEINIPDTVRTIGSYAFYECSSLTDIQLPDSITTIANQAFTRCYSLTNINLPDDITSIGGAAFEKCWSLTNITIPAGITCIEGGTFAECKALREIQIPDTVTSIGAAAFQSCNRLTDITLPDSITSIERSTFAYCDSLTDIILPDSITGIGKNAFIGCGSLTNITIPANVTSIEEYAFEDCNFLSNVTIQNKAISINPFAFRHDYTTMSLKNIYFSGNEENWIAAGGPAAIGNSGCDPVIHYIGEPESDCVFRHIQKCLRSGDGWRIDWWIDYYEHTDGTRSDCSLTIDPRGSGTADILDLYTGSELLPWEKAPYSFQKTDIKDISILGNEDMKLRIPAGMFRDYTNVETLSCSSYAEIIEIGAKAFQNCTHLKDVTLTPYLDTIGDSAFENTAIGTILMYEGIESLGTDVFANCRDIFFQCFEDTASHHYAIANYIPYELKDYHPRAFPNNYVVSYNNGNKESFSENIEYCVTKYTSDRYNPQLAHVLAALSASAYNESDIKDSYQFMGFKEIFLHYQAESLIDYSFAKGKMSDGRELVFVVVQGTKGNLTLKNMPVQWGSNFTLGSTSLLGIGLHRGFSEALNLVWNDLNRFVGGDLSNKVFVTTGHSRGAATSNLVATSLISGGVSKADVYSYNFACPDVASGPNAAWNPLGKLDSIFNIGYTRDPVSMVPGVAGDLLNSSIESTNPFSSKIDNVFLHWGKFGRSYWFSPNWKNSDELKLDWSFQAHEMSGNYLPYMRNEYSIDSFKSWGSFQLNKMMDTGVLSYFACPVDVSVKDSNGKVIASVIGGEVDYHGSVPGDVIIFTDGDKKLIYTKGTKGFTFDLLGTDKGTMDYAVFGTNADSEATGGKIYENVTLTKGKKMQSTVDASKSNTMPDTTDVPLYVLDKNGKPVKEVLPDGKGTEKTIDTKPPTGTDDGNTGTKPPTDSNNGNTGAKPPTGNNNGNTGTKPPTGSNDGNTGTKPPAQNTEKEPPYPDVNNGDWYYNSVKWAYNKGVMTGYSNGYFGPADNLTRGQFATMLYRYEGEPDVTFDPNTFPDVAANIYYSNPVIWASDHGIVTGYTATKTFGPNDNIQRQQMAVMMYRYANFKGYDISKLEDLTAFPDHNNVDDYAKDAMSWAVANGLIKGDGGRLNPRGNANRAEIATIMMRFADTFQK